MNINSATSFLVQQAVWQSPVLLAYVIGIVICGLRARRAPAAATLAIIGLGLMLLATVGVTVFQGIAFYTGGGVGPGAASWRETMMVVSFGGVLLRTAGIVLMVVAVFAGRSREGAGFQVTPGAGGAAVR